MKDLLKNLLLVMVLIFIISGTGIAVSYDFGGETVVIQHNMTFDRMYGDDPEALEHLDWVEDKFNVNLKWTTGHRNERAVEPLAADVMAGGAPDLVRMQSRAISLAAANGLLMPLNEKLVKRDMPEFIIRLIDSLTFKDNYYAFEPVWGWPGPGKGIYYNKEIFEREGLPDPHKLWKNGDWTFEAFKEIAIKATRDTNGDGEIDQYGWGEHGHGDGRVYKLTPVDFLAANNVNIFEFKDGKAVFTLDQSEAIEVYEFLQELMYTRNTFAWESDLDVSRRNYFMKHGKIAMMPHQYYRNLDFEYGRVPFPKGLSAEKHTAVLDHANAWSIPVTTKHNPEALIELLHAINKYTGEYGKDFETQLEENIENAAMNFLDLESLESYEWCLKNVEVYTQEDEAYSPWFRQLNESILREGESPASAIDAIKPKAQSHLNDLFDQ